MTCPLSILIYCLTVIEGEKRKVEKLCSRRKLKRSCEHHASALLGSYVYMCSLAVHLSAMQAFFVFASHLGVSGWLLLRHLECPFVTSHEPYSSSLRNADEYEVQWVGLHPEKNLWFTRDK